MYSCVLLDSLSNLLISLGVISADIVASFLPFHLAKYSEHFFAFQILKTELIYLLSLKHQNVVHGLDLMLCQLKFSYLPWL